MSATLKTRKPVNELTVDDLHLFPIWEFVADEEGFDGQDETWVRPVSNDRVPIGAYSQLVAADFSTAGGLQLQGFMTVTTADGIEITSGALVGPGVYHVLPDISEERAREEGLDWAIHSRKQVIEALGGSDARVFPLSYQLRATVRGERSVRSGVVP